MSISTEARSSQLLVGDGSTKTYAFAFKVFDAGTDITIYEATGESSEKVMSSDLYSVTLNEDQEGYPGGSVTFATAPAAGLKFRIVSSIPYLQKTQLMNLGSFSPKTLNEVFDKLCALIQQVRLLADRALVVPFTQDKTPEEVLTEVLEIAATANEYAQQAALVYQQVIQLRDELNALVPTLKAALESEADDQIEEIAQFAQGQIAAILDSTNALLAEQLDRINSAANSALTLNRLLCSEAVKTFNADTASGSTITLPSGIQYVVGMNHLRLSLNGTILYPEQQYEEVGQTSHLSTQVKLLFPVKANDRLEVWVIPLGGTVDEETGEVTPEAGVACNAETWTLTAAITAGTAITLPNSMKYVAGKKHLRLSWNGILLIPVIDWNETGVAGAESTQIKVNFNLAVGDALNAWTVPYDHGEASTTEARLSALENSLADLSAKVVYKESNNGS